MIEILKEAASGSFSSMKQIAIIVIPIMMIVEIFRDFGIMDKITSLFSPIVKIYGMKKESGFPLVIGIIIGISYGAGLIFRSAKDDELPKRDLYLITYFLVAAHAVFEDTAIFVALGANGLLLFTTRIFVAALVTYIASKIIKPEQLDFNKNEVEM